MRNQSIVLILWIAGLIFTMPVYDKYWAPFDEGIIVVAAQRLLSGEIPYKDFFIVMYPPGQIYALGAIFKIFSHPLIAARIYTILISVSCAMAAFLMTRMLTRNLAASIFAWLICLTSLAPRLGAIPAPIWPGMFLGILSLYCFMGYLDNARAVSIFASGLICGLAMTFRHDIGIFAAAAIFSTLLIQSFAKKIIGNIVYFILGLCLATIPWILYFITISSGNDLYDSLVAFTSIHAKTASLPFPKPCLDLKMIFHESLYFININQFYIPPIVYAYSFILLLAKYIKRQVAMDDALSVLSVVLFGVFTFNQVRIRPDPAHLLTVIPPAAILSSFIIHDAFFFKATRRRYSLLSLSIGLILLILFGLLLVKNVDKYIKNTYTKAFKRKIIKTAFENKGAIYLPINEREDVLNVIKFIKENTGPADRIYIGNKVHWKDDFGGSLVIYYLADRLPAAKFYELLPGLVTDERTQRNIINSLISKDVKLIVLQDIDITGLDKDKIPGSIKQLDAFIERNYRPAKKFGKYNIYLKKL